MVWGKIIISLITFLFLPFPVFAQDVPDIPEEKRFEAVVTDVRQEAIEVNGMELPANIIYLEGLTAGFEGKEVSVDSRVANLTYGQEYRVGDRVIVVESQNVHGETFYYIVDFVRRDTLYLLFFIFVGLTIAVAGFKGLTSIIGMGFSFLVIFTFMLPQISSGNDPLFTAILSAAAIIPVTFYLSHGFNRKTTVAVIGTLLALVITGIMAHVFINMARLTGYGAEEVAFLQVAREGMFNPVGLLLAGIVIGALGVLDDITVSQAAIVYQLKSAARKMSVKELYMRAMDIGKDHIGALVNTLVLVYAGAALPLFLLFTESPIPAVQVINYEIVAEEIIRTLVASIGLISAVPITTAIAVGFVRAEGK